MRNNNRNKRRTDDKKPYGKKEGKSFGRGGSYKKEGGSYKKRRPFDKDKRDERSIDNDDKPFKRERSYDGAERRYEKKDGGYRRKRSFDREKRDERPRDDEKSSKRERSYSKDERRYEKKEGGYNKKRFFDKDKRDERSRDDDKKPFNRRSSYGKNERSFRKDEGEHKRESYFDTDKKREDRDHKQNSFDGEEPKRSYRENSKYGQEKKIYKRKPQRRYERKEEPEPVYDGLTRLNKYIANAGICSRREADDLITSGVVSVNGKVVTEMGYKVKEGDEVRYNGEPIKKEKMVYVLLNKPKDFITTMDDPGGRKTVLELVRKAGRERLYPVGRLDRNTTGVLLMTNDGELTAKLTHPKYGVKKVYHVTLDKNFKATDMQQLSEGITLEDGFIKPDIISYVADGANKNEVGVEIHSGKNRIVRRMFEKLGYEVVKLDRVIFAGLTKKDLPRGRWRFLTEKEIGFLKMMPK